MLSGSNIDRSFGVSNVTPINVRAEEHSVKTSVLSRAHSSHGCSAKIDKEIFSFLCSGQSILDLKVKEAYLIKTLKPEQDNRYESIKHHESERHQKQSSDSLCC